MTQMRRAVAVMALALTLTACSGADEEVADAPAGTQDPAGTEPDDADDAAGTETTGPDAGEPTGAGVRDLGSAEVVVQGSYTMPGTQDEVTVGVLPLEVEGDVLTLRLAYTPDFDSVSDTEPISFYDMGPELGWKFRPVLIDRENLKEYSLISSTGRDWSADGLSLEALNGETTYWWGVYAAPEDDIDAFDVRLPNELLEFTDVPVP